MPARLLSLGAAVMIVVGCGAETVPSQDVASPPKYQTARFETVVRGTVEFRSEGVVDFGRGRSDVRDESGYREITIGTVSYGELPPDAGAPPGKHWGRYDGSEIEARFMETLADESGSTSYHVYLDDTPGSPAEYLVYLRRLSRSEPAELGREEIRGVATLHVTASLENSKFWRHSLAQAGWSENAIDRYLEQGPIEGDTQVEAWVDAEGYARRIVITDEVWTSVDGTEPGQVDAKQTTTEFFDFGVPVEVEAPPEAEVIDWDVLPGRQE